VTFEDSIGEESVVLCVPFVFCGDCIVSVDVRAPRRGAVIKVPSSLEDEK
jgi:hypothetical protein